MFLSVSIPIYNAEQYIDRCINSIVMQDFDDYELILVDDGSIDNSLKKCNSWKDKYPEIIKVVEKENTGSLFTRRVCLKESKGDYIYIMDADDYLIDKKMFREIYNTIKSNNCDLVIFNSTSDRDYKIGSKYPFESNSFVELTELYDQIIVGDSLNSLWNKVFSRELVDWKSDYSGYANVTNGTDMFQVLPILFSAKRVFYLDKLYYFYQFEDNHTSIVHKFKTTIYTSLKYNFLRLYELVEKNLAMDDSTKEKLAARYMLFASTAAYKTRLLSKNEMNIAIGYLKEIGEDKVFRDNYKIAKKHNLGIARKTIVYFLYHRFYSLLALAININSIKKK